MNKKILAFLLAFSVGPVFAGPVDEVGVTAFGIASTKQDAIKKALVQAVEQVNGVILDSREKTSLESIAEQASASADASVSTTRADGSVANATSTALSKAKSSYAKKESSQDTTTEASGVVRSWRLLGLEKQSDGLI